MKTSRVNITYTICILWYLFYILTHTFNYLFVNFLSSTFFSNLVTLNCFFFKLSVQFTFPNYFFFQSFYQLSFQLVIRDEQDNVYENEGFTAQTNTKKCWDEIPRTSIELTQNTLVPGHFGVIVVEGKVSKPLLDSIEPCSVKLFKGTYMVCLKVVQLHSSTHMSTCNSIIFSTIWKEKNIHKWLGNRFGKWPCYNLSCQIFNNYKFIIR